ncbi:MAG: fumarylacetoacetate hydrolase family protein [Desulfobacterales bacterium]|jgi:2-keto-4-pentenoate hydratase/2-oxohepta-3-ene-1,7-dioic acid hydratase in catechol pathway|nr:fumarylacetoacetate hydrolase family protein [Desulfobacterales bacterium]MDH3828716.1 fumarylacetoacetate hydrolase family protein [Desulfobacterales bacterium]
MRLIRFGPVGQEKPGLWQADRVVDLRAIFPEIPDISERFFKDGWLQRIQQIEDPGQEMDVRLGCPLCRPSKIICLGLNYLDHNEESGFEKPQRPLLFSKTPNALTGPFDPIMLPQSCDQIDWEVELAVVIGRTGKRIAAEDALDYVAGFSVLNDVSGRQAQFSDSQWFRGKSFDTFAPMGPALVTIDEIENFQNLKLTARVNGEIMQDGNSADMIFDIPTIIAFISQDITLWPGDIISTGTPSGVGIFRDPPVLLKAGDVVECRVENVGTIRNTIEAES